MKKFRNIAVGVLAFLVGGYAIGQLSSKSIETEITIDAEPAAVWQVLSEFEAYPEWNPLVQKLSGEMKVGSILTANIQPEGQGMMVFTPEILVVEENKEFRWLGSGSLPGLFDGEHSFVLEATDDGKTVFHHGESFTGALVYPVMFFIEDGTLKGFSAMNKALKARVEARL